MKYLYLACRPIWQKLRRGHYWRIVSQVNRLEESLTSLGREDLDQQLMDLYSRSRARKDIKSLIPMALAIGREYSRRVLEMRHYDVQLMGTLALYEGHIAEMDTGEGKTLMAPLAAFLHHLEDVDRSVHIVTANEYLAARDAQWMGPLYKALELSVGLIVPGQSTADRVRAYQNQVIYATSKEIVFDSLREPVRQRKTSTVDAILRPQVEMQLDPKYDFAIVDEVDSVLIDQASSPLSLGASSQISPQLDLYRRAEEVAGQLVRGKHYRLMHDDRKVELKDEGRAESRSLGTGVLRLLPAGHKWERYVTCSLAARYIYKKDQHYVARDGKIILIDESTGRLLPGRQLQDGLHQAVEVHNGFSPSAELRGNIKTTFQTFFRKYKKLAGMTGTASIAALEFLVVYGLKVLPIPPNKPSRRTLLPDNVYRSNKRKLQAVVNQIESLHATGRPLLIATGSVKGSEELSVALQAHGLAHEVLNAKNHAREAEIIAQAGHEGKITIITNMAGRGVDIVLGEGIADKGGIFLLSTDRLAFHRLDLQLSGRIGRQGDPGDCQFFLSLRDDLMRYANRKKVFRLRRQTRNRRSEAIASPAAAQLFNKMQRHIDKLTSKQRRRVFKGEKHREKMKEQGLWAEWMNQQ
jgi:preprotein translocase subunit SecA